MQGSLRSIHRCSGASAVHRSLGAIHGSTAVSGSHSTVSLCSPKRMEDHGVGLIKNVKLLIIKRQFTHKNGHYLLKIKIGAANENMQCVAMFLYQRLWE